MIEDATARMANESVDRRKLFLGGGAAALGVLGASQVLAAAPAAAAGYGYTPIAPYRSFDSRSGGNLPTGYYIDIDLWTDQSGSGRIPSSAAAVSYNLTVTQTVAAGWMLVWPANLGVPDVSNINWWASNLSIANGGVVALGFSADTGSGSASFGCGGGGAATHFIVDVTGYYM
jgi:hypothetical protein